MPKDEFDAEDPLELCGVGIFTGEDTTDAMTECFIEEFMRLGYNHKQLLALFRNPHYIGMNMALQNKGEQFVRDRIAETFAKWGRPVTWPGIMSDVADCASAESPSCADSISRSQPPGGSSVAIDPMGDIIPEEILKEAGRGCAGGSSAGDCACGKKSDYDL